MYQKGGRRTQGNSRQDRQRVQKSHGEGTQPLAHSRDGLWSTEEQRAEKKRETGRHQVAPSVEWEPGDMTSQICLSERLLFRSMGGKTHKNEHGEIS